MNALRKTQTPNFPGPQLHLHGPHAAGDTAFVIGNRDGLLQLRAAIESAIACGVSHGFVHAGDGEQYGVFIACVAEGLSQDRLPYRGCSRPVANRHTQAPYVRVGRELRRHGMRLPAPPIRHLTAPSPDTI